MVFSAATALYWLILDVERVSNVMGDTVIVAVL